jgi:hypothetical protein
VWLQTIQQNYRATLAVELDLARAQTLVNNTHKHPFLYGAVDNLDWLNQSRLTKMGQ